MLLGARVELHRRTGRPGDRLVLEEQTAVAEALGYNDADELMRDISAAARRISWTSDEVWIRVDSSLAGPFQRRISRDRDLGAGIVLREGVVELRAESDLVSDPLTPLRVAAAAAGRGTRIERRTLDRMARSTPAMPTPVVGRGPSTARRPLVVRRGGATGDRGARPARTVAPPATRVGGRPLQAAAQRLPHLHGRPSPVAGRRERGRARRSRRSSRPVDARGVVPRHREGSPRRPHGGRHRRSCPSSGRAWGCPTRMSRCCS